VGASSSSTVFVVQHAYEREPCRCDEVKLIGVFPSHATALAAVETLSQQPGFREYPNGFHIDRYHLGSTQWQEGFGAG